MAPTITPVAWPRLAKALSGTRSQPWRHRRPNDTGKLGSAAKRWWYRHYPSWDEPVIPSDDPDPSVHSATWCRGRLRVHRSALVILLILVPVQALGVYAGVVTGDADTHAMALALVWLVLVAPVHHELAHVLAGRRAGFTTVRFGIRASGYYVSLHTPEDRFSPGHGVPLALAGPASDLAVSSVAAIAIALPVWGPSPTKVFVSWVTGFEAVLAVSNLIPREAHRRRSRPPTPPPRSNRAPPVGRTKHERVACPPSFSRTTLEIRFSV